MKKRIAIPLYCFGVTLFVIYLAFANTLAAKMYNGDQGPTEADFDALSISTSSVHHAFDILNVSDTELRTFYAFGWAFCDTETENPDNVVKLYLISPDRNYELPCFQMMRADLGVKGDIFLEGNGHGFICDLSLLKLQPGQYHLYIYCKENERDYGIIDTRRTFLISESRFEEIPYESFTIQAEDVTSVPGNGMEATLHIDMPQVSDKRMIIDKNLDTVSIAGWAVDAEAGQPAMYVYMLVGDRAYQAQKYERPDLTTMNPNYLWAGFRFDIPVSELTKIQNVTFYVLNYDGTQRYLPVELAVSFAG
jgi:hypothetical protein